MIAPGGSPGAVTGIERLGWGLCALSLGYAGLVHHGVGPGARAGPGAWYQPRGFLQASDGLSWMFESDARAIGLLVFPAAALALGVLVASRSALAAALALSALVCVALFAFYGTVAERVWAFFHWRGSLTQIATGGIVGAALAAPRLARSWLRLRWPLRTLCYAPVCVAGIALLRNATGTDEDLAWAVSPWPAIAVFGLEGAGAFLASCTAGVALGVHAACSTGRARALGLALALCAPALLLVAASELRLLPFSASRGSLLAATAFCAVGIALAWRFARRGRPDLRRRRVELAVAAAGIALPLLAGSAWARVDYTRTREHRARAIIEALDAYYASAELYPDTLDELVAGGQLEAVPQPAIGFRLWEDRGFRYQSFGTSYLLEFVATRWVECAYNSPYADDDEPDPDETLQEAWSCPAEPPELW